MTNSTNLPKEIIAELKLKKNESKIYNYDNKLRYLIWKDKKQIYMLINVYDGNIITKTKFDYSEKQTRVIKILYMISIYNKYLDGIDRTGPLFSCYISIHR
jgi:hypothetical protein